MILSFPVLCNYQSRYDFEIFILKKKNIGCMKFNKLLALLLIATFFFTGISDIVPIGPCLETVNSKCTKCLPTYYIEDGRCFTDINCPPRKYRRYGQCIDVSPLCGNFDFYTGFCLNCADPIFYTLISATGICLRRDVICGSRQFNINNVCFDVSPTCNTFEVNTGKCLTCINNLYRLNIDGTCTLIILNCPSGQYQDGLLCVTIPLECQQFNFLLKRCSRCIRGFTTDINGICIRIPCPPRHISSSFGNFCQQISSLCGDFDSRSGVCLTCSITGYVPFNGQCKKVINGLVSCRGSQQLGYGIDCGSNFANCVTYDLQKKQCYQCDNNYYLDENFKCALKPICPIHQYVINNQCRNIPLNCLTVNQVGQCTRCVSAAFRLVVYQCVLQTKCQTGQYLTSNGVCVDLSPLCDQYNPTNGWCITCKNGANPQQGICCPIGYSLFGQICVDSTSYQFAIQYSTSPDCLIKHPIQPICAKCSEGYKQDLIIPYGCTKK